MYTFAIRGYIATIGRVARRAETIELAVLGLLHEGPMHGYELRKRLNLHARLGSGAVLRLALPGAEEDAARAR